MSDRKGSSVRAAAIVVLAGASVSTPAQSQTQAGGLAAQPTVANGYGQVPLAFEANRGQTDRSVDFLARGVGYTLFLASTEAVLRLAGSDTSRREPPGLIRSVERQRHTHAVLRLSVIGAHPAARGAGRAELRGKANYFIGDDPARWRSGVPTFGRVEYHDVYPGIDLVYYGTQGQLEYDFIANPGSDPRTIALRFDGADRLEVASGGLVIHTAAGVVRQKRPSLYQEIGGGRQAVTGSFVLRGRQEVGFRVGRYDHSRPLFIDPVLIYSTYIGGGFQEFGSGIAVDAATQETYITGFTESGDFPTTTGAVDRTFNGSNDVFVTKLDPTGSTLLYSTYIGGNGSDLGIDIAMDAAGAAYVAGYTASANFPTTPLAFQTVYGGGFDDAFVVKLDPTGSHLLYSTYLGGSADDIGHGIAVGGAGNAYAVGWTGSANFPTTALAFDRTLNSNEAFVTELSADGSALVYSTFLGGTSGDFGFGVALDDSANAYVTGSTDSTDFPTTPGAFDTTDDPGRDTFVAKVNASGSALVYSTYLGGGSSDEPFHIAVDNTGRAHVTGQTSSTDFPTTAGAFDTTANGLLDVFVTKLSPTGSSLEFSTFLGGSADDSGRGIDVDAAGNVYVTGITDSAGFPTADALQATLKGSRDAFVTKLNSTGSAAVFSTYLGGTGDDQGLAIAVDASGNAYVTGGAAGAFPTTPGAYDTTFNGARDGFVAKIGAGVVATCATDSDCDDGNLCTIDRCVTAGSLRSCSHSAGNPGAVCRPSAGACDVAEACTGTTDRCPADVKSTAVCRPAADVCDVAETCDGLHDECPADTFKPVATVCRASAGACDLPETCTGAGPSCPPDTFQPTAVQCRPATGPCDVAESCTGEAPDCPPDRIAASGTICRAAVGDCDTPESCEGTSAECPANHFQPGTATCRPSAGACDLAESCTGTAPVCPPDLKSTALCRPAAGDCDTAESCNGIDDDCPVDAFQPPTTGCRPAAGECDSAEFCTGSSAACPTHAFAPATTICRPAANPCDLAERCTGSSPSCPANQFVTNGTPCDDGRFCTHPDTCTDGVCGGQPRSCDDDTPCTTDACNEDAGACEHVSAVPACEGKMTGGGQILADGTNKRDKRSFGFNARGTALVPPGEAGGASGRFNYVNHATGVTINGPVTFMFYASPTPNGGEMKFEVTTEKGCKYNVTAADRRGPGHSAPPDALGVEWMLGPCPPENTGGAQPLDSGNIQWHDQ
jgi:beta-propeller repeat-containing protein